MDGDLFTFGVIVGPKGWESEWEKNFRESICTYKLVLRTLQGVGTMVVHDCRAFCFVHLLSYQPRSFFWRFTIAFKDRA